MNGERRRREGIRRGIDLLPSLLTTMNLFCGFFSVVKSLSGDYVAAGWAILFAGVFDLLDGRIARLAKAESEFGIEYDSLVDLASFGLAPSILIYTWSLAPLGKLGWLAAFLFFSCGALRLARYNVQVDNIEEHRFQGLPIPMAASTLATGVILHQQFSHLPLGKSYTLFAAAVGLALLMVSSIPYRSFKAMSFRHRNAFLALVMVVIGIVIIALNPEAMLFGLVLAYVASGVVEELFTLRQSRRIVARMKEHHVARKEERKLKVVGGFHDGAAKQDDDDDDHHRL